MNFYVLLEFQSICFYILTSFYKLEKFSLESGLKYFILNSFSSILLLFGIVLFYGFTGVFYIQDLNLFLLNFNFIELNNFLLSVFNLSFILILSGFFFKLYAFPFHF
jgi:NADH-quinone oxidoreductase subunit N